MEKISKQPKRFDNKKESWNKILETLGKDIEISSLQPRGKTKYFHAKREGFVIKVDKAENHSPSSKISSERQINFDEFVYIANLYNDYIRGKTGIRQEMRDNCHNTSYILSLINEIL